MLSSEAIPAVVHEGTGPLSKAGRPTKLAPVHVLDRIRLVLLRPRNPENLGAVARAMKNFELATWSLVDPRTHDFHAARRVAVHSAELLDRPEMVGSMFEAVARASWVVGTSSRAVPGTPMLDARRFAEQAVLRATEGQEVALVFGDERSGMTNEEVSACHALARIPSGEAQPSLNLAQALTVFAYELKMASESGAHVARPRPVATEADLEQLETMLGEALTAGGFLHVRSPRHALRDLMRALQRAQLSPKEWRLWMAAAGKLASAKPPR
jgi:tRNA/rRNA methyltransferase